MRLVWNFASSGRISVRPAVKVACTAARTAEGRDDSSAWLRLVCSLNIKLDAIRFWSAVVRTAESNCKEHRGEAKKQRLPTMESTVKYAQTEMGEVLLSHTTHKLPPSTGMPTLRLSTACAK